MEILITMELYNILVFSFLHNSSPGMHLFFHLQITIELKTVLAAWDTFTNKANEKLSPLWNLHSRRKKNCANLILTNIINKKYILY